jgi:transcriptional regulator with XRE-family HTH domain
MEGRKLVAHNIRRLRVARDISQERLAFDAGVDRSYLGGIERGEENPSVDALEKIAAILVVEIRDFFDPMNGDENQTGLRPGRKPSR